MSNDENQKEPHFKAVTDTAKDVRDEAKDTFKSVKRSIKNPADTKKSSKNISSLFTDPIGVFESIANAKKNKSIILALFVLILWTIISFVNQVGSTDWAWETAFVDVLSVLGSLIKPFCSIAIFSVIVYIYETKGSKNLSKTITNITFAQLPFILGSLFKLIDLFSKTSHYVTDPVLKLTTVISMVYTYFAVRSLLKAEDETDAFKTYVLIQFSYIGIMILIGFIRLGLYLL